MDTKSHPKVYYSRRLLPSFVIVFLSASAVAINILCICTLSCLGTWILVASTVFFCAYNYRVLRDPEIIHNPKQQKTLNLVYFILPLIFLSGYFVHKLDDFGYMKSVIYSTIQTALVAGLLAIYCRLLRSKILAPFIEVSIPALS